MWFDTRLKLAEIEGGQGPTLKTRPTATIATTATNAPTAHPLSQLSRVSQPPEAKKPAPNVANVENIATPETFPHGFSVGGNPLTWTGRIVSLEAWRALSEWEKHGPNGRLWCGIRRAWVQQ